MTQVFNLCEGATQVLCNGPTTVRVWTPRDSCCVSSVMMVDNIGIDSCPSCLFKLCRYFLYVVFTVLHRMKEAFQNRPAKKSNTKDLCVSYLILSSYPHPVLIIMLFLLFELCNSNNTHWFTGCAVCFADYTTDNWEIMC